jgi:hypothetical protein
MSSLVDGPWSGSLVVLPSLEHGDVIFFILNVLVVHDGDQLYVATFSLLGGCDVIHLVQRDGGVAVVLLGHHMWQLAVKYPLLVSFCGAITLFQ